MADDFNVRFGSNAKKFSQELINDLKPARAELIGFIKLLGDVDAASRTAMGRAGQAIGGARPAPNAGGGATSALAAPKVDMSGVEREIASMTADLDGMIGKLNTVITGLGRAVPGIENFVKKQNYSQGSRGKYDAGTDTPRGGGGRYSSSPGAVRDSERFGFNSKLIADAIKARDAKLSQPARVDFSGVTKLQLDQAGFDRVVGKLEEIKAAINARGGAGRVAQVTEQATTGKKSGKKTKGTEVTEAVAVTSDELDKLRADIKKAQELVVRKFGGQAPAELTAGIDAMKSRIAALDARSEREATGASRGDQSAKRRAEAEATRKKFADLDRAEYDARKRRLELIQNAGRADFAEQANKRGKGGLSREHLIETAQAFQDVGFDVNYGSKTSKPELAKRIGSARQAYEREYGGDIPEQLRVGTPPAGPDKISNDVKKLLGSISAKELEEERQARETRRLAYQVGNVPKDPTERALHQTPGAINVPPGMVKGGGFYDAFGLLEATKMLDHRSLGRAAVAASDPGFNPFAISEKEHISGGGDAAKQARASLREVKRATRELDTLGAEYDRLADSLRDNRQGMQSLEGRIGTDREKKGDGDRLRGMEQSIRSTQKALNSPRFAGLQDVFEDPQYQAGRRNRDLFRQNQEEERQRRQEQYEAEHGAHGRAFVNDAASSALAGARTGIGTRGFMRPIPGLRPDGQGLAFTDAERNPADLKDLNKAFRRYRAGLKRETNLAKDLADGVEGITEGHVKAEIAKTDNQITKFLNELNRIFGKGVAPNFEGLIGRAPQTKGAIEAEAQRNAERDALNARAKSKPPKPTDLQVAAQRAKDVDRTEKLLERANKDLTAARSAETKAAKKAEAATNARPKSERDAIAARTKAEARVIGLTHNTPADRFKDAAKLVGKDPRDLNAYERQQQQDYREYSAGYAERLTAARHDVSELPDHGLSSEEQTARDASKKRAAAEQHAKMLAANLAAQQGRLDEAQGKIGGKEPEVTTLQKRLTRSQNLRKELTAIRGRLKAALDAEDAEAAAVARTERDALKEKNKKYLLTKAEQKQLNQRIASLNAAAGEGGTGGGGKPPTANAAGGGAGGRDGGQIGVLRQILASVNGIREQLRTGVRRSGTDSAAAATRSGSRGGASIAELRAAQSGDEREQAKAAVQQQRRLERLQRSGTLPQAVDRAQTEALKENERITKSREQAVRRSTESARAQARAELMVANTMRNLDQAAKAELGTLGQLIREGASNTKIVEQQGRAYAAMNRALAGQGVTPGVERHKQIRDVLSATQGRKVSGPEADDIRRSAAGVNGFKVVDNAMAHEVPGGGIFGEQSAFTKAMFGNHGFWSRVMASTGTFVVRNFTAGFVFGLTNALQDVVRQGIITESTFIRVSDALEQTGRSSGNLRTQLQGISSQYGTNLEDVYETAAGLVGLFPKIDQIAGATRVVSQLQAISMGALNAQEAMGALASITGAYGKDLGQGVDGLTQVADVLTVVQNVIGTNVETTAEGVGALSGLSKQLKIDFQDTAVYVAQIAKLTNQTGAAAGDQFSRILAAMQTGRGRASLTKNLKGSGIETQLGEGNYGGALQTLLKNWDKLSDGQQRNIAISVAGQRQARAFYALMNNSSKVLDASARAHDAQGQAAQRAQAIANTLNGQIAKLTSNLQNLAQNLVRTGLLDFFGVLLHVVNGVLSGVNHVFSVINDFADSNPILNFLKHVTAGLVGFLLTAKLAQLAFRGFRASLGELRAGEGVMAAGVQGALGKGGVPAGPTLRQSLRNAPGALGGYAQRVRNPRPRITDYVAAPAQTPIPGRPAEPQSAVKQTRPVQGPMLPGGGFYANAPDEARVTRTARAMGGMSNAMDRVKSSALGAQLGVTAAFTLIFAAIDGLAEHAARADEYRRIFKEQTGRDSSTEKGPNFLSRTSSKIGDLFGGGSQKAAGDYIGPYTEQMQKNIKQSGGIFGGLKAGLASGIQGLDPHRWNDKDFWSLDAGAPQDRAQGKIDDDTQKELDDLAKRLAKPPPSLRNIDGQGQVQGPASDLLKLQAKQQVGRKDIDAAIKKIDEDTSLSDEQRTTAMAGIEKLQKAYEDNLNTKILAAQGIASQDVLSSDQLGKLSGVTSLLVNTATSGGGVDARNPHYADLFKKRLEDTGIRTGSTIGKSLSTLAQGGLNKGDALTQVRTINNEAIKQLQAKIKSMEGNADPEEIDQLQSVLDQFTQDQSGILQQIIDGIGASATAIADVAAGRGHYGNAAGAIRGARDRVARLRDRASEPADVRAQRDSAESAQSERAAELTTQGQTWRLNREKARGVGAQRSAQIDAQTARTAYSNLILERAAAQAAGAEGPTISAIRDAKNNWLQAQRSSAMAAQDANIAQMTAAAAGLWNGIAIAASQENIALQQYANAKKNFGANSAEALNALAAYKGAQKSTQQTMDQVAESRRQAMIAAIPSGNAVGVARAQLSSARAAVAAAEKYGHNSTEYQGALSQLYSAQQQAISAQSAVRVAQAQLAQAYATARGDTVGAARAGERVARAQLAAAKKASGGANSADVINARAQAISARAATRDAILQDRLDTIDFNLQMGKITQSSAISAMQQILRTSNLTKQQRRDLLLKIKGMKDEIADTQWNFGSMDLPTPYQMRRYVRAEAMNAAQKKMTPYRDSTSLNLNDRSSRGGESGYVQDNRTVMINGTDTAKVRAILQEILGNSVKTRTAQGRRR